MSKKNKQTLVLFVVALSLQGICLVAAPPVIFESGEAQTSLVELFTSEGCSSCPPAEAWLSKLKANPDLWKKVVPVAFHVDYWDNLGWRDRFAQADFTLRQRHYADRGESDSVYTPEFFVNGKEWRHWSGGGEMPAATSSKGGKFRVSLLNQSELSADFEPPGSVQASGQLHAALLGVDLESDVKRGENSGRKLRHDFVVLRLESSGLTTTNNRCAGTVSFPKATGADQPRALAAWITAGDGSIIQATGGWLR